MRAMIPARAADIIAIPTVPKIHFLTLSFVRIYGIRSSVPGIIQVFVWQTHISSTKILSITLQIESIISICKKALQKSASAVHRVSEYENVRRI